MKNREQLEAKIDFRNCAGRECTFTPAREKELYSFFKKHQICRRYDFFSPQENDRELFPHFHAGYGDALYASSFAVQTRKIVFSLYRLVTGWLFQDPYAARLELNG